MSTLKTNRIEPVGSTAGSITVDGNMVFTQGATFPGGISVGSPSFFSSGVTFIGGTLGIGTATFNSPSGTAPIFGARAWVTFKTNASNTATPNGGPISPTILGSGNIAGITLTDKSGANKGNGLDNFGWKITFATPMPTANYAVVGMCNGYTDTSYVANNVSFLSAAGGNVGSLPHNKTTTSFDIIIARADQASAEGYDNGCVTLVVFC